MAKHILKTWPQLFAPIADGVKTFDVRFDDRGFQAGDDVLLVEYDPNRMCYCAVGQHHLAGDRPCERVGRSLTARVGYVLHATPDVDGIRVRQLDGFVVLALLDLAGVEVDVDAAE